MFIISFSCIYTVCDVLRSPNNSYIVYSQTSQQSEDVVVANYFCNDGFILINMTEDTYIRTCQASGVWSGIEPSCIG